MIRFAIHDRFGNSECHDAIVCRKASRRKEIKLLGLDVVELEPRSNDITNDRS